MKSCWCRAGEILRAKQAVLRSLELGLEWTASELQWVLVDEPGIQRLPDSGSKINVPATNPGQVGGDDPLVACQRLRIAGRMAIGELADEGVISEVVKDSGQVRVQLGGTGGGVHVNVRLAPMSEGYEIPRRFRHDVVRVLDPDIFSAALDPLNLDERARLCVREALQGLPTLNPSSSKCSPFLR